MILILWKLYIMLLAELSYLMMISSSDSGSGLVCEDGDLRLADVFDGGAGGRVEFCHQGQWGTVCEDDWDSQDAAVVCRQLGLPTKVAYALPGFGGGNGSTIIDNVGCTGDEERLKDCLHNGIGMHNCPNDHSEDAGVFCSPYDDEDCSVQNGEDPSTNCAMISRRCLQKYGNCVPYNAREIPAPCDYIYQSGVDYVYIPDLRYEGSYSKFMDNIIRYGPQLMEPLERCTEALRVICHFYLPPCGNSTHFEPPTSVCSETCHQMSDHCPAEWEAVMKNFEEHQIILAEYGMLFIDCDNPGQYLSPLPHCCSNIGFNGTSPTSSSNGKSESLHYVTGIVVSFLAMSLVLVTSIIVIIAFKKHHKQCLFELARVIKERQNASIDHNSALEPYSDRLPRVNEAYIHQMQEDKLLIPRHNIKLMGTIGQGEFGVVFHAYLCGWKKKQEELVAVKTLKGTLNNRELNAMVEESLIMSHFDHSNVMKLIGVSIQNYNTLYIVMPFMANGSLLSYLRNNRPQLNIENCNDTDLVESVRNKLLLMCIQIAKGMKYLVDQKFVHRDLAARNCMIDDMFVIKVADFGLSEDIYARNYFRQGKDADNEEAPVKLPIKWMALESLNDGIFSEKSDVWSFGVTCWEVFSLGKSPYPGVDPFTLINYLENGERLGQPANHACSDNIYNIMLECWKVDSTSRPKFSTLVLTVTEELEKLSCYMDLNSVPLETTPYLTTQ